MQKIHQKLMSDPNGYPTLQSIVLYEVQTDVARVRNSATEALLWLGRGLKFLKEFLSELHAGEQNIQGALSESDFYDGKKRKKGNRTYCMFNIRPCSLTQIMPTERPSVSTTDGLCEAFLL